jgi:hypothetical protein
MLAAHHVHSQSGSKPSVKRMGLLRYFEMSPMERTSFADVCKIVKHAGVLSYG